MSSYVLIRAFDVHDCMDQPTPAPRCSLGSTAFELELLDLLSELGPAQRWSNRPHEMQPRGTNEVARVASQMSLHTRCTRFDWAPLAAQLAASESKDTHVHRTAAMRRCSLS